MMTHNEIIAVIAAHRDGKTIQRKYGQRWIDIEDLGELVVQLSEGILRVKPEPRRGFVPDVFVFATLEAAKASFEKAEIIEFVEVVE